VVLAHHIVGHGPVKVLLAHTWLADHQTYAPMLPFLDVEGFTWAFPDFRGYGGSRGLAGEMTIREMGRDLLGLADALGWKRFHLVGNSMGGQAAQWLAGQPEADGRIESLVLLCAVPARGFSLDAQSAAFFASTVDSIEARGQAAMAVTGSRLGAGFAAHMRRLSAETAAPDAIRAYLRAWTEEDVSAEIGRYTGPVRAFVGEHDPVLTEAVARAAIAPLFPGASVAVLPGTGHYPSLELPARTAALLAETIGSAA